MRCKTCVELCALRKPQNTTSTMSLLRLTQAVSRGLRAGSHAFAPPRLAAFSSAASSSSSAAAAPSGASTEAAGAGAPSSTAPAYTVTELPQLETAPVITRTVSTVRGVRGHTKKLNPLARQVRHFLYDGGPSRKNERSLTLSPHFLSLQPRVCRWRALV